MSEFEREGWWRASNGRWYPPDLRPGDRGEGPQAPPAGWVRDESGTWVPPVELEPEPAEPRHHWSARRGAVLAVSAAAAAVGVAVGLLIADATRDPAPSVDSETIVRSTLPPATAIAPVPGSSDGASTTSAQPVTPTEGP